MEEYINQILEVGTELFEQVVKWLSQPTSYYQAAIILAIIFIAPIIARIVRKKIKFFSKPPARSKFFRFKWYFYRLGRILYPLCILVLLKTGVSLSESLFQRSEIVNLTYKLAIVYLIWIAFTAFVRNKLIRTLGFWIIIPMLVLNALGLYEAVSTGLNKISLSLGDEYNFSLFSIAKILIVSIFIFWLGNNLSNQMENMIRKKKDLDITTRELLAKLLEMVMFGIIFLLIMNVAGIDLTALAVLGGALGVGIGFGLQKIASNFISGIILILERKVNVGDIVELDDGTFGEMVDLGSRASTIKTYDGKEVMIPNEDFITTRVTNWTGSSDRIRYEVEFGVSYDTDINKVPDLITKAVLTDKRVLKNPEMPDVELRGFGDSSIDFAVEFWCKGIDDGKNKFTSDIMFIIWNALRDANIEIPFPQRDVHIKSEK